MSHIVVIGAGVIGLQSAICLLEAGFQVTIIAEHFPGDEALQYTSPWAGAHWRTHATASPEDKEQREWDLDTYREWERQLLDPGLSDGQRRQLPFALVESLNYWDADAIPSETPWWAAHVTDYHAIPLNDPSMAAIAQHTSPHLATSIGQASSFRSIALDAPAHLHSLLTTFRTKGGALVRATLPPAASLTTSLSSLPALLPANHRLIAAAVNATGLAARSLVPDPAVHAVKGQTVLVRGEARAIRTRLGKDYISYVIPRPGSGTTILGGTKEVLLADPAAMGGAGGVVSAETTAVILERARGLAPELVGDKGEFEVVSAQVGLRPARTGGARVELEVLAGGWRVVHAYGHAGAGYQNSVGVARKVVRLVKEALAG